MTAVAFRTKLPVICLGHHKATVAGVERTRCKEDFGGLPHRHCSQCMTAQAAYWRGACGVCVAYQLGADSVMPGQAGARTGRAPDSSGRPASYRPFWHWK